MEDATSTRQRDTKNSQKFSKRPPVVTNKHPENQDVFSSSKLSPNARVYVKSFSGANTIPLGYYIVPVLVDEKPNNLLIHIGLNEIMKFNYNKVNEEELAHSSLA